MANGNLGLVDRVGWDMGNVLLGESNLYEISQALAGGSLFNVTLNWFRDRDYTGFLFNQTDNGQADLSLQVVNLTTNQVISESMSQFKDAQLILQFYDLRRESRLREARAFVLGRFKAHRQAVATNGWCV